MTSGATIVPGSWWFGRGWLPWRTATSTVTIGATALTLPATPCGPLGIASPNGTLGGRTLPPSLTVTPEATAWLLNRGTLRLFDALSGRFRTIHNTPFSTTASSVAAASIGIAISDPQRSHVIVLDPGTLSVRAVLPLGDRRPVSLAVTGGRLLVLDDHATISTPALGHLRPLFQVPKSAGTGWQRIAVDTAGRLHVAGGDRLVARTPEGRWAELPDATFPALPLPVDHRGRFQVPPRFRVSPDSDDQWFDSSGRPVTIAPEDVAGPRSFATRGTWTSEPLDSAVLGCRWRRTTLTAVIPPGCAMTVRTFASDTAFDPATIDSDSWARAHVLTGRPQPRRPADSAVDADLAVLADRGRFLSVKVELSGDGWDTPAVGQLLVEPQAPGLERFLPAVYRSDEQTTDFLRRFLAIFARELEGVEHRLRTLPARFSPDAVPDRLLAALAAELGVALEQTWAPEQQRVLLAAAPALYPRRGTPAAITNILREHLRADLGRPVPSFVPAIIEGYRERPEATIGRTRLPTGAGVTLWSDSVVDRPRLGAPGRHDTISLISVGDQLTDRFRVHANRFKVLVPRGLLPDADARDRFERLVAAEKPAHVDHEVILVEPRTVLGRQALLGVDAYLGSRPPARLVHAGDRTGPPLGRGLRLSRGLGRAGRGDFLGVRTVLI
ncbi:phage tail protein [Actinoplanes sp. CA-015351]|uniref:phage tail protein n=1 Tax=Actinoplanes sp. CA-015351 TaxID=3239897 RepID=UPI003D992F58